MVLSWTRGLSCSRWGIICPISRNYQTAPPNGCRRNVCISVRRDLTRRLRAALKLPSRQRRAVGGHQPQTRRRAADARHTQGATHVMNLLKSNVALGAAGAVGAGAVALALTLGHAAAQTAPTPAATATATPKGATANATAKADRQNLLNGFLADLAGKLNVSVAQLKS